MQVLKINFARPSLHAIKTAKKLILSSGLIIYPCDTAGYSVGVNALNKDAVARVFKLKERSLNKPLNVNVSGKKMASELVFWNEKAEKLANKFWPGGLTLVLPKKKCVPDIVTAGLKALGVRCSKSQCAFLISRMSNTPITMSTANISEVGLSSFSLDEIISEFKGKTGLIDLILDAGELNNKTPSTIIDLSSENILIIRQGVVKNKEIEKILCRKI